jgi:ribonuclease D
MPAMAQCIERALSLPDSELPHTPRRESPGQLSLLGQFLSAALTSICRSAQLAPSLVGTASDVRDLIAYRMGYDDEPPLLARGWREDVVGHVIEDLLEGKTSIRIRNPRSEDPLAFEENGSVS